MQPRARWAEGTAVAATILSAFCAALVCVSVLPSAGGGILSGLPAARTVLTSSVLLGCVGVASSFFWWRTHPATWALALALAGSSLILGFELCLLMTLLLSS